MIPPARIAEADDQQLIARLRAFDDQAFVELIERHHDALVRFIRPQVRTDDTANDVVQETWLAVLRGLGEFQERSSLKTWIYRIALNRAITRGEREGRMIPFSALVQEDLGRDEPAVDPERFRKPGEAWPGHWSSPPRSWSDTPEENLLGGETRHMIEDAVRALPPVQQQVLRLRDIEGFDSVEVCNILEISETNQRVLLHRARSKVRAALEQYLGHRP